MISPKASLAAGLAGVGLAVALNIASPAPARRIYLPSVRSSRPAPTAQPVFAKDTETLAAYAAAGMKFSLVPGRAYRPGKPVRVASGTSISGNGALITRGLILDGVSDITLRDFVMNDCRGGEGDCISVIRSTRVTISGLDLTDASDGLLDIIRAPAGGTIVSVSDTLLHDHPKCMLVGHQWVDTDDQIFVQLNRVRFEGCNERIPKVQRARVDIVGGLARNWVGQGMDVRYGAFVTIRGRSWFPGPKSRARWTTAGPGGGTVTETP